MNEPQPAQISLARIELSGREVERLISRLDDAAQEELPKVPVNIPLGRYVDLKGELTIDVREARPRYRGSLELLDYENVKVTFDVERLRVSMDLNDVLGIKEEVCIKVRVCGEEVKECYRVDLPEFTVIVLEGVRVFDSFTELTVHELLFEEEEGGFVLYANLGWVKMLGKVFTTGLLIAAVGNVGQEIRRFLERVIGNGTIAKLIIAVILNSFRIVEKLIRFIESLAEPFIDLIDGILTDLLGEFIRVKVSSDPILPKKIEVMPETDERPEPILYELTRVPEIDISQAGLVIDLKE